jgi:hypothetical protein
MHMNWRERISVDPKVCHGNEFSVQLRAFDAPKSGHSLGVPALLCAVR